MVPFLRSHVWHLVLVLALVVQTLAPAALAASRGSEGVGPLVCVPSGEVSAQTQAAIAELYEIFGLDQNEGPERLTDGHCPLCVLVQGMPLPQPAFIPHPPVTHEKAYPWPAQRAVGTPATGPPLGQRGPPTL